MDETIGVKGGHNDFRRTLTITKDKKEKLKRYQEEQELKELEKKVKHQQRYTLIKTLPIVIVGQLFNEISNNKPNKEIKKEKFILVDNEEIKEEPKTRKVIIVLKDGTKQIINVPIDIELKEEIISKEKELNRNNKKEIIDIVPIKEEVIEEKPKEESKEKFKIEKQEYIPIKETSINEEFKDLTQDQKNKLQRLQARKIIDVYEKQLKDIRYELRNLIIDYNLLVYEEENIIKSKEEERILDKLNEIIEKIEELKEKIRIENLDKYDDNYIYTLVEGYLSEFKDKKIIKEIKDSPLYVLISEKLDEFDKRKDKFKSQVEDKKEELDKKDERLEELREKYFKIEKISDNLNEFYKEQEMILREIQDKISKSTTVTERVKVQVETMDRQTTRLLRRLSLMMLIPGKKGAKALAMMTMIYASMAKRMINPRTITTKYKEVEVKDYSTDIENSIKEISNVQIDINKSRKEIEELIKKIKEEFSDYIGVIPECDNLLSNLEKVKSNIKEKEYEVEQIKLKQEKELERNNSKLLERGTYKM